MKRSDLIDLLTLLTKAPDLHTAHKLADEALKDLLVFPKGYFFSIYSADRRSATGPFQTLKEARARAMSMPNAGYIYKVNADTSANMRKYRMNQAWRQLHGVSK